MGIKVAKFGGSSVADAIQIGKIKEITENDKDIKYVVVSAPGKRFDEDTKVTDLLYLCLSHRDHKLPYEQVFQAICERYIHMEQELGIDVGMARELAEIQKQLEQGASTDYVVSRGEYLNGKIIAKYMGMEFKDPADFVKFSDKGKFLEEETNEEIARALRDCEKAVIPGFYGSREDGSIKTFSRGGSDITGSIVARAVEADVYENWTDVSGFLVADPRIVDNPRPISSISYKELRELAYMGASVLHEEAIYPARVAGIPINIRNTNRPDDPGTMITSEPADLPEGQIISGIAGSKDFTSITIYSSHMIGQKGFIRRMAGILEDNDVTIEHIPSGIDTVSVIVNNSVIDGKLDDILDEFERQLKPDSLDVQTDLALIATVGAGMASRKGTSARLFTALAEADVNIKMIDQGASEMNIIVGVRSDDFEKAIRAIYKAFVS